MDLVAPSEIERALEWLGRWDRVEIEIGSGSGHFLAEYAARARTSGFLGIESKSKRCAKIEKKIAEKNLDNVRLFRGKAESLLARLTSGSVDAFHVYFPDPWPKTKHRRRRLFRMPAFDLFHRILKDEGRIFFGTDVHDYFLQVKVLGIFHGGFDLDNEPVPPEAGLSMFNQKTRAAGKTTRTLVMRKIPSGS